jgi:UrcA family protein
MFTTASHTVQRAVIGAFGTALFAGLSLSGALAPANAAEVQAARVQTVSYADLNLSNAAGRATFEQRVKAAAQTVCASGLDTVAAKTAESRCVRNAIEAANIATRPSTLG